MVVRTKAVALDDESSPTLLGSGDAVRPAAAPGAEIPVGDLLP